MRILGIDPGLTKTGFGAILKPQIKPRPDYQGEVEQVIDCVS